MSISISASETLAPRRSIELLAVRMAISGLGFAGSDAACLALAVASACAWAATLAN